jgi:hypothetical protein
VVDVDVMDPNMMKKILVMVDHEDVVDDEEEISMELDDENEGV